MRTKHLFAFALVVWLIGMGAWAVSAQTETPTPDDEAVTFPIGDNEFDLDPTAPITLCVVGVTETIDDAYVTVQVFARTIDPNRFEPLGVVPTRALGDVGLGDCLALRVDE